MTPELILATIKSGFDFGVELLRFLQTAEGSALVKKSMEDRAAWDKFWIDTAGGVKSLFKGDLFK